MDSNTKKTEDDPGNRKFVVEVVGFSTICKRNKAIWDIMGMEVSCGNLLAELMGCNVINTRGINDGVVRATG